MCVLLFLEKRTKCLFEVFVVRKLTKKLELITANLGPTIVQWLYRNHWDVCMMFNIMLCLQRSQIGQTSVENHLGICQFCRLPKKAPSIFGVFIVIVHDRRHGTTD